MRLSMEEAVSRLSWSIVASELEQADEPETPRPALWIILALVSTSLELC
jgi:hypothetical protein